MQSNRIYIDQNTFIQLVVMGLIFNMVLLMDPANKRLHIKINRQSINTGAFNRQF